MSAALVRNAGGVVPIRFAEKAGAAYEYPLLVRHLLHTALATTPLQEIVYRDRRRYSYLELTKRIGRLATVLARMGADAGSTVAILDWDSHRYLECYFAVPMMGAVLQTVNVRLSAEQILYTLRHANAEFVLLHHDFLPLWKQIRSRLTQVRACILIADEMDTQPEVAAEFQGEYESLLCAEQREFEFQDFDENALATTFYTTGTTGQPKVHYAWRLQQRTLVLGADDDPLIRPYNTYMLAAMIPDATLWIMRNEGHLCLLTSAPEVAGHVARFLRAPGAAIRASGFSFLSS